IYINPARQRGNSSQLFGHNVELWMNDAVCERGRPIVVPQSRLPAADGASRRSIMKKAVIALMAAASLPLAACASTTPNDNTLASAGTGAAIGAAGGAGVAALTGGSV